MILKAHHLNPYRHVAIISNVTNNNIEITQQNPDPFTPCRVSYPLNMNLNQQWTIKNPRILDF